MAPGLLTAGGGHPWETDVVAALDRPGSPLTVVRRCADIADVLATASTGQAAACLLAGDLRRLDAEAVQRLRGFGVAVVVVHSAADSRAPVRLDRIGVTAVIPDDAGAAAMVAAVLQGLAGNAAGSAALGPMGELGAARGTADPGWALDGLWGSGNGAGASLSSVGQGPAPGVPGAPGGSPPGSAPGLEAAPLGAASTGPSGRSGSGRSGPGRTGRRAPDHGTSVTDAPAASASGPTRPAGSSDPDDDAPDDGVDAVAASGAVLAVWGPGGAPGRSMLAAGIADQAAASGLSVLLIDADVYGGLLASAFGLLDESTGLAGACRLAGSGRLEPAGLAALCWTVGEGLGLLTGIARADRWPEVRPSAVPGVLGVARQMADLVVVDCSAVLETDEEITFDTMAPRRNGATLAVLGEADLVLAVGSADPPGMERLIRGLAELTVVLDGRAPQVVLNRVRSTAAPASELTTATRRFAGTEPVAMLPEDRAACDRAWQRATRMSVAAPTSSLTRGLAELTRALLPQLLAARHPRDAAVPR